MMFRYLGIVIAVELCGMLSGCGWSAWEAKWGPDKPHISYVSLEPGKIPPDKLYVWNPNNNAAYVFHEINGKEHSTAACLASADVAKARNSEGEIKIDLGKILEGTNLEGKQKILDTVTKLSERNEAASFLNVALFHICMIDLPPLNQASESVRLAGVMTRGIHGTETVQSGRHHWASADHRD